MALKKRKIMLLLLMIAFISLSITLIVMYEQISNASDKNLSSTEPIYMKIDDEIQINDTIWLFQTPRHYHSSELFEWTEAKPMVLHKIIPGNGENGEAFTRINSSNPEMKRLQEKHNYNLMATEMMSLHRTLPDYRFAECKEMIYPKRLPKASIILIFHNEAWSLVLRSVWSIIERSPRELVEEIILVDDLSTWPELARPIEDYIELLPMRVRLIRNKKREGLIRSRLIGAEAANGQILIFFDAHVEMTAGWLEPLLANIAADRSLIAVPHIDWITSSTMKFDALENYQFSRYSWALGLYWTDYPKRELLRTNHSKAALLRLPMHVGCAFAVDREFFYEIGAYDEGMDIWGSENLELALRVWMCGGSLQLVQCSRIGHFYRISTYSFDGNKNEIMARNDKRVAEVWMDEFKEILYTMKPYMRNIDAGNLTERLDLRKQLKCKSYRWFLENIYPENRQWHTFVSIGPIKNMATTKCVDIYDETEGAPINLNKCHNDGGNQFVAFSKMGLIIAHNDKFCISVSKQNAVSIVTLSECVDEKKSQIWHYNATTKVIQNPQSGFCLLTTDNENLLKLGACDFNDKKFKWILG